MTRPNFFPSSQAWNPVVHERGKKEGQGDCHSQVGGLWPLAVRKRALCKPTLSTRTSSRLLKPFRLRLLMSFSSVRLSTCDGQESMVSSGLSRAAMPALGIQPCPPQLPAQETDGQKLPCTVTHAFGSVQAQRREPSPTSGARASVRRGWEHSPPNHVKTFQSTKNPCDMGRDCLLVNDLGLRVVPAGPADAAPWRSPPTKRCHWLPSQAGILGT